MAQEPLTEDRILAATEEVLRRFGPSKATVVDVARALDVSHGSVYRHFPTKAALREAVTRRWLGRSHDGLRHLVTGAGNAEDRLRAWLAALFMAKRRRAGDDPELFATYKVLAMENSAVAADHVADLVDQLAQIVTDGVGRGEFIVVDPGRTAQAIFTATAVFHDPAHGDSWLAPDIDERFDDVVELCLRFLRA